MRTDIPDPTPLDQAIWQLYLVTREVKPGPLAPFVRRVGGAARALFPVAYGRACHDAFRAHQRAYDAAHREEKRAYDRAYRLAHSEERRGYKRAYDAAHREERRAYDRAYRLARRVRRAEQRLSKAAAS